jgi:hypothetical protein
MAQIEIADATATRKTLVAAQQALIRQFGRTAPHHISKLQRIIDQIDVTESLERDDHIRNREYEGQANGIWALGRFWYKNEESEMSNGKD